MRYRDSYRNPYEIWYRPITSIHKQFCFLGRDEVGGAFSKLNNVIKQPTK